MELKGKNILIIGLGKSGAWCAKFLKKKGAFVTITDRAGYDEVSQYAGEMENLGINLDLGGHSPKAFEKADLIVISPGVPHTIEPVIRARKRGVEITGEMELASRFIKEPVIAITGTNGKTTTTTLTAEMLKASGFKVFVGGNIGTPLIRYLNSGEKADIIVLEVSSFQLDTIKKFRPNIAMLLNISPDHLDRYENFESYAKTKAKIFENQKSSDFAILNFNDPFTKKIKSSLKSQKLFFNCPKEKCKGIRIKDKKLFFTQKKEYMGLEPVKIKGKHNIENIAAASLGALCAGASTAGIKKAVKNFTGLAHRLEYVGESGGVLYYNDSKATNTDAALRAVESFDSPVILIMGGRPKGDDYSLLADAVKKRVKNLILTGEAAGLINEKLGFLPKGGTFMAKNMDDAVSVAAQKAGPGDVVLLAPACSSFDMFENYAQRGEAFKKAVKQVIN